MRLEGLLPTPLVQLDTAVTTTASDSATTSAGDTNDANITNTPKTSTTSGNNATTNSNNNDSTASAAPAAGVDKNRILQYEWDFYKVCVCIYIICIYVYILYVYMYIHIYCCITITNYLYLYIYIYLFLYILYTPYILYTLTIHTICIHYIGYIDILPPNCIRSQVKADGFPLSHGTSVQLSHSRVYLSHWNHSRVYYPMPLHN